MDEPGPHRPPRIVLVGFMCVGKTTVGEELARRLGWDFLDMDRWIEERVGRTVVEIFRERGEAGFREEERRAALAVADRREVVVAAGGGAFAEPETRRILATGAITVWLKAHPDALLARLPQDGRRPLASDRGRMLRLLTERESSYRLADRVVDTSEVTPEEVARRILDEVFSGRPAETGDR